MSLVLPVGVGTSKDPGWLSSLRLPGRRFHTFGSSKSRLSAPHSPSFRPLQRESWTNEALSGLCSMTSTLPANQPNLCFPPSADHLAGIYPPKSTPTHPTHSPSHTLHCSIPPAQTRAGDRTWLVRRTTHPKHQGHGHGEAQETHQGLGSSSHVHEADREAGDFGCDGGTWDPTEPDRDWRSTVFFLTLKSHGKN